MTCSREFQVQRRFEAGFVGPAGAGEPAWWFCFRAMQLLVRTTGDGVGVPCVAGPGELGLGALRVQYIGLYDGRHCWAAEVDATAVAPKGTAFEGVRDLYERIDGDFWLLAGRALHLIDWDRNTQFCGRCGHATATAAGERAKVCPDCGHKNFTQISPAIIVMVHRGPEILLVRSRRHPAGMYSNVAGFVEPGETLEVALRREVREEAGIDVQNVRYVASQAWPFPNSLMIGFIAEYASGELSPDLEEIEDLGWFTSDRLPRIPGKVSIARKLIDWFLAQHPPGAG